MVENYPDVDRFEELVQEALETIPDDLWNGIDNVYVSIEEWPTSSQLASVRLRHPAQLLGLYEGIPLTSRSTHYGLVMPDKITIFRQPILRHCRFGNDETIRQQVRRTVIHEVAHHFGISDDRLRELGAY